MWITYIIYNFLLSTFKDVKSYMTPYDPAIPLLGIYPDKTFLEIDTCTCMFVAALFTWKQYKRPSTDEWIKKM